MEAVLSVKQDVQQRAAQGEDEQEMTVSQTSPCVWYSFFIFLECWFILPEGYRIPILLCILVFPPYAQCQAKVLSSWRTSCNSNKIVRFLGIASTRHQNLKALLSVAARRKGSNGCPAKSISVRRAECDRFVNSARNLYSWGRGVDISSSRYTHGALSAAARRKFIGAAPLKKGTGSARLSMRNRSARIAPVGQLLRQIVQRTAFR